MPLRYLPPVSSPLSLRALARAGVVALRASDGEEALQRLAARITERFGAAAVALTDSGTSALVLALRAVVPEGGIVALPAYGCVDLVAAAIRAAVRVRLYDIDPRTLGPDLDSLQHTLSRGVDAVVVAHLYGYPAPIAAVQTMAAAAGVAVIEDAAQHAGARLGGVPVGSAGPVTVLSFGRGKGTTGGRGGAVLATTGASGAVISRIETWRSAATPRARAGWRDLGLAAGQWAFGGPALYSIPASIPALGLGQTVYRPAGEPGPLSRGAAALVARGLAQVDADRESRARRAAWYTQRLAGRSGVDLVQPLTGSQPGYLRFPILRDKGKGVRGDAAPHLGIVRTYPRPLDEEPAIASVLESGEPAMRGARALCERLLTLPTHAAVHGSEVEHVVAWVRT